jgi:hypothetical protein
MPFDQTTPLESAPRPDWDLPEIIGMKIRSAEFRPHKTRNFKSPLVPVKNAVEIVITLKSPMPIRAMAPVLYVGDIALTESEPVDKTELNIRFWALEPEKLPEHAPISMAWTGSGQEKRETKFSFRKP